MVEQWEEFKIGPKDLETDLHVTLSRKGEILVGARACERFGNPEAVVFLFDKLNSKIGLLPAHKRVENAYPLTVKNVKYKHRVIHASRFCRNYGIKTDRRIAFTDVSINEEGIMVLDLKTTTAIGTPKKSND